MTENLHLYVRTPFHDYAKGDRITDPTIVAELLAGETSSHVMKVQASLHDAPIHTIQTAA